MPSYRSKILLILSICLVGGCSSSEKPGKSEPKLLDIEGTWMNPHQGAHLTQILSNQITVITPAEWRSFGWNQTTPPLYENYQGEYLNIVEYHNDQNYLVGIDKSGIQHKRFWIGPSTAPYPDISLATPCPDGYSAPEGFECSGFYWCDSDGSDDPSLLPSTTDLFEGCYGQAWVALIEPPTDLPWSCSSDSDDDWIKECQ